MLASSLMKIWRSQKLSIPFTKIEVSAEPLNQNDNPPQNGELLAHFELLFQSDEPANKSFIIVKLQTGPTKFSAGNGQHSHQYVNSLLCGFPQIDIAAV